MTEEKKKTPKEEAAFDEGVMAGYNLAIQKMLKGVGLEIIDNTIQSTVPEEELMKDPRETIHEE